MSFLMNEHSHEDQSRRTGKCDQREAFSPGTRSGDTAKPHSFCTLRRRTLTNACSRTAPGKAKGTVLIKQTVIYLLVPIGRNAWTNTAAALPDKIPRVGALPYPRTAKPARFHWRARVHCRAGVDTHGRFTICHHERSIPSFSTMEWPTSAIASSEMVDARLLRSRPADKSHLDSCRELL